MQHSLCFLPLSLVPQSKSLVLDQTVASLDSASLFQPNTNLTLKPVLDMSLRRSATAGGKLRGGHGNVHSLYTVDHTENSKMT